ncbi:jg14706 [Pararge aegeria aegeria]|uniref:Jg14706 protein n=1 Tax=Pararge aegeria aegeria TaxID=348720 RepID=A0A8S4SGN0_9NEOP|nr:jg14706 [Pararge aegeria aegeria]
MKTKHFVKLRVNVAARLARWVAGAAWAEAARCTRRGIPSARLRLSSWSDPTSASARRSAAGTLGNSGSAFYLYIGCVRSGCLQNITNSDKDAFAL